MHTLYLQVEDANGAGSYPVRLGMIDTAQPGAIQFEHVGSLPTAIPPAPAGERMGAYLHSLLASGGGARMADMLASADPLSVVVDMRPADLAMLPWEGMEVESQYLFIDSARPWSRGRWNQAGALSRTLGPLRVLVVVCDPSDPSLRAADELDGIHRAVSRSPGRIHLEVIDSPESWTELRSKLVDLAPQVVHFIGHARLTETHSVLEFSPRSPDPTWELRSDQISNSWPEGARLVVISACKSSASEPPTGVKTLTDALTIKHVPAVLGMRGDISSSAAVDFAAEFYGSLAEDRHVDAAAAAGRRAIFDRTPDDPDWQYPVLETQVPASHVLPIRFGIDQPRERQARRFTEFAKLHRFVDRAEQRRRTWWAIDAEELPGGHGQGCVLITGPRGCGKTWLALASLLTCYLRGRRLQYIDLCVESSRGELGERTKDWLAALRAIRDGVPGCELSGPLESEAFATFTARLNWLVERPPGAGMPEEADGPVEDEWKLFDPDSGQVPVRITTIFKDFVTALGAAAAQQQLVLALDGIDGVTPQSWHDYVMPNLIAPLASGVPGVSLLLIVPEDLAPRYAPAEDVATMERVEVWGFEREQIDRVVREYGVYAGFSPEETLRLKAFIGGGPGLVPPKVFRDLERTLLVLRSGGG
jgi:hypothetical protein